MNILLTGGTGYIGSHTAVSLIELGHTVVIYDNLCNSNASVIDSIEEITSVKPAFVIGDIRDSALLERTMSKYAIEAVIHCAGLKAVGESVQKPLDYYDNNVSGTVTMLSVMKKLGIKRLIFSSSSTVYGTPQQLPLTEEHPVGGVTNPYGRTKLMIEEILKDLADSDPLWSIVCLRYFNPIGAHESGLLGENPNGIPNNLLPYVARVASGQLECVNVYGNDYDTPDGTGVRDYIHVVDLARGHVKALSAVERNCGLAVYNLGTGQGYSVLDVVKAFEQANGLTLPYEIKPRRAGDVAKMYSSPEKAKRELGWEAEYGIEEMCRDAWNWQKNNPNGYEG